MLSLLAALAPITSRPVASVRAVRRPGVASVFRGRLAPLSLVAQVRVSKREVIKSPILLPVSGFLIIDF
jgi:hypothetical protein